MGRYWIVGVFFASMALVVYALPVNKVDKTVDYLPQEEAQHKGIDYTDYVFPHDEHTDEFGYECAECHHEINAKEFTLPHPQYFEDFWVDCTVCHHEKADYQEAMECSSCHKKNPRNNADETLSGKVAIHASCWSCHDVGTGSEASESCEKCHTKTK